MNYGLGKVIGDDETGFRGTADAPYRTEGWEFILAGGGLYNNLDYSFVAGEEAGTFAFPPTQPGGGGVAFRAQMKTLRDFINAFDFIKMRPDISPDKGRRPRRRKGAGTRRAGQGDGGLPQTARCQGGRGSGATVRRGADD